MVKLGTIAFMFTFAFSQTAMADLHIGSDVGIIQDQNSLSSRSLVQNTFLDGYAYVQAARDFKIYLGFEYVSIVSSQPLTATTTSSLTSSNFMAAIKYVVGRSPAFEISAMYGPFAQANYSVTGAASELWTGSTYMAKLSLKPELWANVRAALAISYFSATYYAKSGPAGSTSGFNRSIVVPTFGLQITF